MKKIIARTIIAFYILCVLTFVWWMTYLNPEAMLALGLVILAIAAIGGVMCLLTWAVNNA